MAQTTPREALTCFAISYFCGNGSDIETFSNIVYKYYFDKDISGLNKYNSNLENSFIYERIRQFKFSKSYTSDDIQVGKVDIKNALMPPTSKWKNNYNKLFPNGTLASEYCKKFEVTELGGEPNKLDGEIYSAYATAEILKTTPIIGKSLSSYQIFDQASDFMKIVKDDSLNKTIKALELPKYIGSDILSSVDIILVLKSSISKIQKDFKDNISGTNVDNMTILNNLAYGTTGKNTYRTITNKYFIKKEMVGVSLKKVPTKRKANIKIVGSVEAAQGLELYLDPYTEFLARVQELHAKGSGDERKDLAKLIDDMVEICEILPPNIPRTTFDVKFKLNYKSVNIGKENVNIKIQIGRTGFNATEGDQLGFVGGSSYAVSLPVLKKYPLYNTMVNEIIKIRESAFKFAVDKNKVPSNLMSDYTKALNSVKKNVLVLYDNSDNENIKDFCEKYDSTTKNGKNSFQEYRIAVIKLCTNKTLKSPHGPYKDLNKDSFKISGQGVNKILHNNYVHIQGLWIYTRKKEQLKIFFKKQISLTLYGLMSKKGARVFFTNKNTLSERDFVKEFKSNNNKIKLAKVITAPFILIS
jgi:hypothetical protein